MQIVVLDHQILIQGGPRGGASNDQESNFSPHKSSEGSIFFTPTKKWIPEIEHVHLSAGICNTVETLPEMLYFRYLNCLSSHLHFQFKRGIQP